MSKWQPIETAPKDKTGVIIACPSMRVRGEWVVGEAYFSPDEYGDGWWWANTSPGDYHSSPIIETNNPPTHWQPMPAPPAK